MTEKYQAMREGGKHLRRIKNQLQEFAVVGRLFSEVEELAQKLIRDCGAKPNFSLVPGYKWAICINKNEGIVHGLPNETIIEDGDLISIDLGLLWQNWNLDTSISFIAGKSTPEKDYFLAVGQKALRKTIDRAMPGNSIYDLSHEIEKTIKRAGFDPSGQLAGHYIGRKLHEDPLIPCVAHKADRKKIIKIGDTMAIEVMYAMGNCDLVLAEDGWTYETRDRSWSALFEDTIIITENGAEVLT